MVRLCNGHARWHGGCCRAEGALEEHRNTTLLSRFEIFTLYLQRLITKALHWPLTEGRREPHAKQMYDKMSPDNQPISWMSESAVRRSHEII